MSFSLFFTITGIIFTIFSSIVIKDIYNFYPINKITEFLKPTEETVFNRISISVFPIIIWAIVECPILGYNTLFLLGLLLNIVINCSICYIIYYGRTLISHEEETIIPTVTIILANIIGYLINYLTLFIGKFGNILNSIIGLSLVLIVFLLIRIIKPNMFIFKNEKK